MAHSILEKFPNYAPAWKEIAGKAEDINQRLEAIKKGLELNPDLETKGMLLINQAAHTLWSQATSDLDSHFIGSLPTIC